MTNTPKPQAKTPTKALEEIEAILNEFHEETRVTMCQYLLDISEQTVELL